MNNRKMGPLKEDHPLVKDGDTCPGCKLSFETGDFVTLITVGPGTDPEEKKKAAEGRAYNAVAMPAHWSCVTGEE